MEKILEIKGLKKSFGEKQVVKGITLDIGVKEIVGFLGPNGAGKSTTINMIATILNMDEGAVLFKNKDVKENKGEFKKELGLVPQDIAFFSDLSVYDNVKFFGSLYDLSGSKLKTNVQEALEHVGLWERRKDYPDSFSGGMKRRLNIACSIVHRPKLLIMDEPTVGIDPQSRNNILEVTKKLRDEGTTIIYISHYMEEVESICSRLIIIDQGIIIEQGDKDDLKKKYKESGLNSIEEIFLHLTGKELRD
ncbi:MULTISPECIES: ABC transporter ATP-binding protein [Clostridium]|uniref:ABC transporter ATP-binding protein n=1 Tax=Clostridium frigoriphilum TaxID=443253 RepID=A0ABU7UKK4_9CLOT|nr:ABC transporter ATP-binding protein [Clostridium sp. DSM 17811]MBU3101830.1 ABC transporter ATP-binding protein [Clostridium sp. DSM 17811]